MYEDPREDRDYNYEPPPSQPTRVFSSAPLPRGEYVDSCRGRPERPPKKPQRPGRADKRLPPTPGAQSEGNDEEDYITPDGGNDDDNYIEPEENPPHRGRAMRELPRLPLQRPTADRCELPDTELKPQPPPVNRLCPVPSQSFHLPSKPSPRPPPRPTTPELAVDEDEYEMCDADDTCNNEPRDSRPLPRPKPLPRERSPKPPVKPKIPAKPSFREIENRTLPVMPSEPVPAPSKVFSLDLKRPKLPIPNFLSHRHTDRDQQDEAEDDCEDQDKELEMHNLPWFADSCDRKTADDALLHSSQDGAFLVRNSSGQDALQPYTLVVFYNGRVYNIPIRYLPSSQQYALGREKRGEEYFSSVPHIIAHHQRTPLVLIDGQSNAKDATRLQYPVRP